MKYNTSLRIARLISPNISMEVEKCVLFKFKVTGSDKILFSVRKARSSWQSTTTLLSSRYWNTFRLTIPSNEDNSTTAIIFTLINNNYQANRNVTVYISPIVSANGSCDALKSLDYRPKSEESRSSHYGKFAAILLLILVVFVIFKVFKHKQKHDRRMKL